MSLSSTAASRFLESRIGSQRRVEVYAAAGRREIPRSRWLRSGRTDEQRSKRIRMRARAAQEVSPEMGRLGAADPSSRCGGDLQLRPVRPADRERIIEITKDVWEGRDYIPRVFDSWVADAGASFQAAEIEGVVVGVQRLRPYAPGLVWYEGLRVAAAQRRHGIGKAMLAASIGEAREQGFRQMRLATRDLPARRRAGGGSDGLTFRGRRGWTQPRHDQPAAGASSGGRPQGHRIRFRGCRTQRLHLRTDALDLDAPRPTPHPSP